MPSLNAVPNFGGSVISSEPQASNWAARRFRTRHVYALQDRLICGVCDRKVQAHWFNEMATQPTRTRSSRGSCRK